MSNWNRVNVTAGRLSGAVGVKIRAHAPGEPLGDMRGGLSRLQSRRRILMVREQEMAAGGVSTSEPRASDRSGWPGLRSGADACHQRSRLPILPLARRPTRAARLLRFEG